MNHFTAIVDYGVGNLMSVTNAMRYLGLATCITSDPAELERAEINEETVMLHATNAAGVERRNGEVKHD